MKKSPSRIRTRDVLIETVSALPCFESWPRLHSSTHLEFFNCYDLHINLIIVLKLIQYNNLKFFFSWNSNKFNSVRFRLENVFLLVAIPNIYSIQRKCSKMYPQRLFCFPLWFYYFLYFIFFFFFVFSVILISCDHLTAVPYLFIFIFLLISHPVNILLFFIHTFAFTCTLTLTLKSV